MHIERKENVVLYIKKTKKRDIQNKTFISNKQS